MVSVSDSEYSDRLARAINQELRANEYTIVPYTNAHRIEFMFSDFFYADTKDAQGKRVPQKELEERLLKRVPKNIVLALKAAGDFNLVGVKYTADVTHEIPEMARLYMVTVRLRVPYGRGRVPGIGSQGSSIDVRNGGKTPTSRP